jgi:hypothetical protein
LIHTYLKPPHFLAHPPIMSYVYFVFESLRLQPCKTGLKRYEPTIHIHFCIKHLTLVWHKSTGLTSASVNTPYLFIFKSTLSRVCPLPAPSMGQPCAIPPPSPLLNRGHFPSKDDHKSNHSYHLGVLANTYKLSIQIGYTSPRSILKFTIKKKTLLYQRPAGHCLQVCDDIY